MEKRAAESLSSAARIGKGTSGPRGGKERNLSRRPDSKKKGGGVENRNCLFHSANPGRKGKGGGGDIFPNHPRSPGNKRICVSTVAFVSGKRGVVSPGVLLTRGGREKRRKTTVIPFVQRTARGKGNFSFLDLKGGEGRGPFGFSEKKKKGREGQLLSWGKGKKKKKNKHLEGGEGEKKGSR